MKLKKLTRIKLLKIVLFVIVASIFKKIVGIEVKWWISLGIALGYFLFTDE